MSVVNLPIAGGHLMYLASLTLARKLLCSARMRSTPWIIFFNLAVASSAHAEPPSLTAALPQWDPAGYATPPPVETTSYRAFTMAADGISIASVLGSFVTEGPDGRDTKASNTLLVLGLVGGSFATPIIHAVRGHGGRAVASYLIRTGAMTIGGLAGIASASCSSGTDSCGLDRIGPGVVGGLIVASVIDAAFLTDETTERLATSTWSPVIAPRHGGGTVGIAAAF